jgi:hypothetical protein
MDDATLLQIGHNAQTFVDNWLIEQSDSVTRRWHKPQRIGDAPILRADRPWEDTPYFTYSNFNVLKDPHDGLVKCWYEDLGPMTAHQPHPWKNRMLLATSSNGIDFEKPMLGRVKIDDRDTNIFAGYVEGATPDATNPWADIGVHSAAVVIDPDPASGEQRYRMLFSRAAEGEPHTMECAYSADGVAWTPYAEKPSFGTSGSKLSDVSTITIDPASGLFLQYTRHGGMGRSGLPGTASSIPEGSTARFGTYFPMRPDLLNKRRVFRTVSADFIHWSDLIAISAPDDLRDNLDTGHYGVGQFRIGATHFGTLGILRYVDNEMDVRLIYSHDGVNWHDTDSGLPFLAPRGGNHWDRHMVSIVSPPVRVGDEWYFYHGGSWAHHDYWWAGPKELPHEEARSPADHVKFGLGVASLRFEGLASLDAVTPRPGRIVTRPLEFVGSTLQINARVRRGGSIKVAVADASGRPLAGYSFDECVPFTGDAVRHEVCWTGGDGLPQPIRPGEFRKLMFLLDDAEIFGFVVAPG